MRAMAPALNKKVPKYRIDQFNVNLFLTQSSSVCSWVVEGTQGTKFLPWSVFIQMENKKESGTSHEKGF